MPKTLVSYCAPVRNIVVYVDFRGVKVMETKLKSAEQVNNNPNFKKEVRLGVIKQLYKENYISDSQYDLLLNKNNSPYKISRII